MKLLFVSLGCDKNLVDLEEMLGLLTRNGHEIADDETDGRCYYCQYLLLYRMTPKRKVCNTILEMAEYKKAGSV